ncbi:MAG: UDP-forming cellulose synthase catalytic subunit [Aquabacterium sp.]
MPMQTEALSPRSSYSRADRRILLCWGALACLLVFFTLLPVSLHAQLVLASVLLGVLMVCHRFGRRAKSLRAQSLWRLTVILVCTFLSLRYIHWRATESLPLQMGLAAMVGGLLLFMAEAWSFVNTLLGYVINSEPFFRRSIPLRPGQALPHVDVYIPTYNEEPFIVRPTVIAATQLDYPPELLHVWILDDGGTDQKCHDPDPQKAAAARQRAQELKALAERFGAGYLTRERNVHAKAGNLNSALQHTQGELLLVLDCDHIPASDFLQRTVGFFLQDPQLFVLQTPHNFVSPDPIERNLGTHAQSPAENELFYDVMQPGLDFWGTSFFCGSAAVLRRSVIDELGGISGRTITEDAETTLDALSLGYKSAYYNRPMVSGLQPDTFTGFIVQRVRWAQGMLQIFILKNPWRQPRLSFMQRVLYTNFAVYWGFAAARLVMLLAPPAYLLLGINLCDTTSEQLLVYAGPALAASLLSTQYFYGRVRWPFVSQLYEVVQSMFVVRGMWQVFRRPTAPSFKVTPKGEMLDRDFLSTLSWPFYILLALTALGVVVGVQRYADETWNRGAIAFVLFWAVLDMVLLLGALGITLERRQLRSEPRAPHRESAGVLLDGQSWQGRTVNASASGVGLILEAWQGSQDVSTLVGQPVFAEFLSRGQSLEGTVQSARWTPEGLVALGVRYVFRSVADERLAVEMAFGSSGKLMANNRERHAGRSIARALLDMAVHATRPGMAHIGHLERDVWRKVKGLFFPAA